MQPDRIDRDADDIGPVPGLLAVRAPVVVEDRTAG
jgi:hypothetical protein